MSAVAVFDLRVDRADNGWVPRVIAAVLATLLTGSVAAPVTCAGWEASANERRQCCQRAGHADCPDQQAADHCCAAHEQSRHVTPVLWSAARALPSTLPSLPAPALGATTLDQGSSTLIAVLLSARLLRPPQLPFAPLRI